MKKFLSLVMALIMVMSLVTVASAADYTDAADVDNTEAVEVMSAVGVFQGSAGKFNPKGILNRAEAAKLIAYLDLGEKTAEALPAVQSFSDVPATHWAAKYVAYCADAGYINGVGDGKFDPTGKLTGYQFGKLLLCVLGYDYTIESFVGANWSIAVAKLMKSNDINKGVKAAPSAELTREDAAQYCLNALNATTVAYASKGTNVTINGVVIATGASKAESVYDTAAAGATAIKAGTPNADTKYTVELGEKLYEGDLVLADDGTDDFGRVSNDWSYKSEDVGSYAKTAKVVYNTEVSEKQIVADLKGYTFDNGAYKVGSDAKPTALDINIANDNGCTDVIQLDGTKTAAEALADLTANGKTVEFYVSADTKAITNIVTIAYDFGKVTSVVTNKAGDKTYTIKTEVGGSDKIGTDYNENSASTDTIVLKGDVAKDDYVTYVDSKNGGVYVYPTTEITGKVTKAEATDYVIVDGTKYPQARNVAASADTFKLWLDANGVVVYGENTNTTSDVVYGVLNYSVRDAYDQTTAMVQIVTADGEVKELKLKSGWAGAGAYTYTLSSGKADLVPATQNEAYRIDVDTQIKTSTAKLPGNYYFDKDVNFVFMKDSGSKLKVTTADGIQAVKKVAADSFAVLNDEGKVSTVFIKSAADTAVNKDDLLFVEDVSQVGTQVDDDGKVADTYEVYQAGEKQVVMFKDSAVGAVGFYSYTVDSTTGRYELTAEYKDIYAATIDLNGSGKVYNINMDTFINLPGNNKDAANNAGVADAKIAADVAIYDLTDNGIATVSQLVDTLENGGEITAVNVWAMYDSKNEVVTCMYITDADYDVTTAYNA